MKHPLKLNSKKSNTSLYLNKDIYSFNKVKKAFKEVGNIDEIVVLKRYYRLDLQTTKRGDVLEFCNYLFTEHR